MIEKACTLKTKESLAHDLKAHFPSNEVCNICAVPTKHYVEDNTAAAIFYFKNSKWL